MDHPKTLYEPTLLKRWAERYRDFECEEEARRIKELRRAKDLLREDTREHSEAA
ncbi:MAG TPA: hypothetical protein VGM57_01120 [Pseudolabrys sp.]|jgi:hypothetical protein